MLKSTRQSLFQSTLSIQRETRCLPVWLNRCEFQSTLSIQRETHRNRWYEYVCDISIHSLHTERDDAKTINGGATATISIHSLHTERDDKIRRSVAFHNISIHSLHTERDTFSKVLVLFRCISIHSLHTERDLTLATMAQPPLYFNPLSPYRERLDLLFLDIFKGDISIHSLHTERDSCIICLLRTQ